MRTAIRRLFIAGALALSVVLVSGRAAAEPPGLVEESGSYPIRVFYQEEDASLVPEVLVRVEDAWQVVIEDHGLAVPLRMVGGEVEEGFDLVVDVDAPGLSAYEIAGVDDSTPITDCAILNYFNPTAAPATTFTDMTLQLLIARSALHAVDCLEPVRPAYDMFGVAFCVISMESQHPYWVSHQLSPFQNAPYNSIDYHDGTMYGYGSALFTLFIDEAYGAGDGSLLVETWARAAQEGTIDSWIGAYPQSTTENEPDFLDAVAAQLETEGVDFDEATIEFARWRYFVGADDDGAHFANASQWVGGEVARDRILTFQDLPIADEECLEPVAELGSSFTHIDLSGWDDPQVGLKVGFYSTAETSWAVEVYLVPEGGGAATVEPLAFGDAHTAGLELADLVGYAELVVAVVNLGDGEHDADDNDWGREEGVYALAVAESLDDVDAGTDADADGDVDTDAGAEAGPSDGGGCSCDAAGARGPDGGLLGLLVAMIAGADLP